MTIITNILVGCVAVLHISFLIIEMFFWTKPMGMKIFRNSPQKAQETKVLAANQGLYNGFLVAGLIWSLCHPDLLVAHQIKLFFLGCVIVAGLYGAWSVSKKILWVQALPAILAMGALLLGL